MTDLSGKTVLVTGGSRGIGAAIARATAAAGAHVLLHYAKSRAAAEALREEIGAASCHLLSADLAEADAASTLWRDAEAQAPRIDVLVNNAGIFAPAPVTAPMADWRQAFAQVMQVNLTAPAELCKLAVAHFRQTGGGKIINIASRAAHRGDAPDQWPYAASKGALVALTKTIARGYAAENILAFAVAPGFTETDMAYVGMTEADISRILSEIPLGSMAAPEEVGALVAFLCGDEVRHMTGATFDINGASYVR
ncbi:SDR family NAD(P)-dependent oxidoreductase [Taklimakanibacter deserti]|uniref:SDR family NAD(P)-dependent oxidoreductase n=1 Tax=Taklimakanibacter deserti TaxID=2267839 RepID=UPI000E646F07